MDKNNTLKLRYKHFTQWYKLTLDKDIEEIEFNKEEVAEVRWCTKEEILNIISEYPDEVLGSVAEIIKTKLL